MKLGDAKVNFNVESVPTGSLSLDIALGLGGVLREELLRYMGLNQVVRQQLHFIWSQKFRREAV